MIKLIILILLFYFGYKVHKFWKRVDANLKKMSAGSAKQVDDVMIKDPYCQVYFPSSEGIHLRSGNKDLYFCSLECRDNFIASKKET